MKHLVLDLHAMMQAWGAPAIDQRRPTYPHPTASGLAGLIGNALGWHGRRGSDLLRLQRSIRFGAARVQGGARFWDLQTADLRGSHPEGRGENGPMAWTSRGEFEEPDRLREHHELMEKEYLSDTRFICVLRVGRNGPIATEEIGQAFLRPASPLYLGRDCCVPSVRPLLTDQVEAESVPDALLCALETLEIPAGRYPAWWSAEEGATGELIEVGGFRDYESNLFRGSYMLTKTMMEVPDHVPHHR